MFSSPSPIAVPKILPMALTFVFDRSSVTIFVPANAPRPIVSRFVALVKSKATALFANALAAIDLTLYSVSPSVKSTVAGISTVAGAT